MRRLLLLAILSVSLVGCAKLQEIKKDVSLCYNDPACFSEALEKSNKAGYQAGELAGLSGFPWASKVAKPVAGYAMLIFSLAALGAKKRKGKNVNS